MKKHVLSAFTLMTAGSLFFLSCDNNGSGDMDNNDSTELSLNKDSIDIDMPTLGGDEGFVKDAIEMNAKELAWLNAGVANATNSEVKTCAMKMKDDHEKTAKEMADYAAAKGYEMPSLDTAGVVDLDEPKGAEWDKAWVDKMVKAHKKTVDDFEDEADDAEDATLKTMIAQTLPTLKSHLAEVEGLQNKMK